MTKNSYTMDFLRRQIARLEDEEILLLIQAGEDELDAREEDLNDPHLTTY